MLIINGNQNTKCLKKGLTYKHIYDKILYCVEPLLYNRTEEV